MKIPNLLSNLLFYFITFCLRPSKTVCILKVLSTKTYFHPGSAFVLNSFEHFCYSFVKTSSLLVLHNLSFFLKNEKWFGEKFFAKNEPRKMAKNCGEKAAKIAQMYAEIGLKLVHFWPKQVF